MWIPNENKSLFYFSKLGEGKEKNGISHKHSHSWMKGVNIMAFELGVYSVIRCVVLYFTRIEDEPTQVPGKGFGTPRDRKRKK